MDGLELWKVAFGSAGGVAAIGAFVMLSVYRNWLKLPIFQKTTKDQQYSLFRLMLILTFLFAVVLAILWFLKPSGSQAPTAANTKNANEMSTEEINREVDDLRSRLSDSFDFNRGMTRIGSGSPVIGLKGITDWQVDVVRTPGERPFYRVGARFKGFVLERSPSREWLFSGLIRFDVQNRKGNRPSKIRTRRIILVRTDDALTRRQSNNSFWARNLSVRISESDHELAHGFRNEVNEVVKAATCTTLFSSGVWSEF